MEQKDWKQRLFDAIKRKKRYAGYHSWDDKCTVEGMITKRVVDHLISSGRIEGKGEITCSNQDPPDCVYKDPSGREYGIEVSEIVHAPSRHAGEAGERVTPHEWTPLVLHEIVQKRVIEKSYRDHSRAEAWLVLHTGEYDLRGLDVLQAFISTWPALDLKWFDRVFILGHYDPTVGGVPLVEFNPAGSPYFEVTRG